MKRPDDIAVRVSNVSKSFRLPFERHNSIKSALIGLVRRQHGHQHQQVLKDVSFDVKHGEFFGIVGRNGSGKSTLLKIIAGIYAHDHGSVEVNGQITPFIELGVGFNPELTGRENLFLNGALLGFSHKEMEALYDDIVAFAEIGKFMDQKLKNYSSGMQVRLAFSIAIQAKSDILILDEVLAVGDSAFQEKCARFFDDIKGKRTVIFVSHDMKAVKRYCDRAIVLEKSEVIDAGPAEDMVLRYASIMANETLKVTKASASGGTHIGSGDATIRTIELLNKAGKVVEELKGNESFTIRVHFDTKKTIKNPGILLSMFTQQGDKLFTANTMHDGVRLPDFERSGYFDFVMDVNPFAPGTYKMNVGIFDEKIAYPHDHLRDGFSFVVRGERANDSHLVIPHSWQIKSGSGR